MCDRRHRAGFTLVELMIVIVVIGIIMAFVLRAMWGAARSAEAAATLSLITKIETGLTDRLDAILMQRPEPTNEHLKLATIYNVAPGNSSIATTNAATQRAQVFAMYDLIRREFPDVWYRPAVQGAANDPDLDTSHYPINFAWHHYPLFLPDGSTFQSPFSPIGNAYSLGLPPQGANGASYTVAAGFFKQAGYGPKGFDGLDNNGNGYVDDLIEGGGTLSTAMANHQHKTARSEMLYTILVEGQGPMGSVFSRDDFTTKEVADTDGDGLMEFVDAWGEPLYFYRWPIFYQSDVQRGEDLVNNTPPYKGVDANGKPYPFDTRESNSLDQGRQLMAPAWWSASNGITGNPLNSGPGALVPGSPFSGSGSPQNASAGPVAFARWFHPLVEQVAIQSSSPSFSFWDMGAPSGAYAYRRPFYSRFLVVSSGPDKTPGLAVASGTLSVDLLMTEGYAAKIAPSADGYFPADDDITNQDSTTASR